ncbi:MAG: DUF423 domain-containing protein [Deltaproteobacteria bacterium]|nr:DUF423 domain-containing protein [Deltaproteobacteria bacterium]
MSAKTALLIGAIFGFLGVAFGAFGAHVLEPRLEPRLFRAFETGARYQLIHALALLVLAPMMSRADERSRRWLSRACLAFTAGIGLFSFSLYAMALSGARVLGAITPFGGLALMTAWIFVALAAVSYAENSPR